MRDSDEFGSAFGYAAWLCQECDRAVAQTGSRSEGSEGCRED